LYSGFTKAIGPNRYTVYEVNFKFYQHFRSI
jgi:hypothetical protein